MAQNAFLFLAIGVVIRLGANTVEARATMEIGVLSVNGKSFFPLGCCCGDWRDTGTG